MPLNLKTPIIYLITSGETTPQTTSNSEAFSRLLKLIEAATAANVSLIQIREKQLPTRVLYDLTLKARNIALGSATRVLVNDRADVARAAEADGVHLTTTSLQAPVIRRTFGGDFLIGVSTHSLEEARRARDNQADFAVFGPVFETASKQMYGEPIGLDKLKEVALDVSPFPILALGGVTLDNTTDCFRAGASGVAAIRALSSPAEIASAVAAIQTRFREQD